MIKEAGEAMVIADNAREALGFYRDARDEARKVGNHTNFGVYSILVEVLEGVVESDHKPWENNN